MTLTEAERAQLTRAVRTASSSQAYALRCRIILAGAGGMSNTQIARNLGISMPTVGKWRSRFLASRTAGLADEPRPGRAPSILLDRVEQVVTATLETLPANATHRTRAAMAARSGPSPRRSGGSGAGSTSSRTYRTVSRSPPTHHPRERGEHIPQVRIQVVAAAMIDRIVHHADVLTLKGASYRLRDRGVDSLPSIRTQNQAD